jgi:peptidoglycan/xylan/chitin deacetylase (PgdA/CDA1 family)
MVRQIKATGGRLLENVAVGRFLRTFASSRVAILMMHRFETADGKTKGHDPARLRQLLDYFRQTGVHLAGLDDIVASLRSGDTSALQRGPTVIFTVDDGYADFVEVAVPVFREFDCPVTGFVSPGIIDNKSWFWWDQIAWIQAHTHHSAVTVDVGGTDMRIECSDPAGRRRSLDEMAERIRLITNAQRIAAIDQLSFLAQVPVPATVPDDYRVATWQDLRSVESDLVRIGAHSMTHPILSRCDDEHATREIRDSVTRVRDELVRPSEIFAYPVGCPSCYGEREILVIRQAGLLGALSSVPGYVTVKSSDATDTNWLWRIPRLPYEERPGTVARAALL